MYAQLGTIIFELLPIESLEEKFSYVYAEHQVIEGKPRLQFIAANLDETTIGIRFHFSFCDPATEFQKLKAAADKHEALEFFFADGTGGGWRVITEITKNTIITADNGRPLCIEAKLCMKEFATSEPLAGAAAAQKLNAAGLMGTGPITNALAAPGNNVALLSGQITVSAAQIKIDAGKLTSLADSLPASATAAAAQIKAATAGITATVGPLMDQAKGLATQAGFAASQLQNSANTISGYSSAVAVVTSGLPGPLSKISDKMNALNSNIQGQSNSIGTMAQRAGGSSNDVGNRARIVQGLLP